MDNESLLSAIKDSQAKKVIYELLKRVDELEAQKSKSDTVIPMSKGKEMLQELGFKSKRSYSLNFPNKTA